MVMITDVSVAVMNGLLYVEAARLHTAMDSSETPGVSHEKEKDRRWDRAVLSV